MRSLTIIRTFIVTNINWKSNKWFGIIKETIYKRRRRTLKLDQLAQVVKFKEIVWDWRFRITTWGKEWCISLKVIGIKQCNSWTWISKAASRSRNLKTQMRFKRKRRRSLNCFTKDRLIEDWIGCFKEIIKLETKFRSSFSKMNRGPWKIITRKSRKRYIKIVKYR